MKKKYERPTCIVRNIVAVYSVGKGGMGMCKVTFK